MTHGNPETPEPSFIMKKGLHQLFAVLALLFAGSSGLGQEKPTVAGPVSHVFATRGTTDLKAYVFSPQVTKTASPTAAIVLFYGGGWVAGEPSWAFGRAQHFAERGMVAVAAQYRLSDQKEITPLDAVEDAGDAIRWVRTHAGELGVDPNRIAAYGWSAGAHLAASTAIVQLTPDRAVSCVPDALVLESPAVAASSDAWFRRLLGSKAKPEDLSPDEHIRAGLPPTIIVEGREDTVTPLPGVQRFADRMKAANNRCELYVFDGAGHLFTPVGTPDDGYPKPDPAIEAAAFSRLDTFLVSLGYMK
jgi:acetyl esterase